MLNKALKHRLILNDRVNFSLMTIFKKWRKNAKMSTENFIENKEQKIKNLIEKMIKINFTNSIREIMQKIKTNKKR